MAEKEKTITREWTLMFYFASDNPLAPNIVSQLKAIKSAGFHEDVNVIAQFDPNVPDMPTHIFDVNAVNKIGNIYERFKNLQTAPYKFWKANDPYIRNLVLDRLWNDDDNESPIRKEIIKYIEKRYPNTHYDPPVPSPKRFNKEISRNDNDGPGPKESLQAFLNFCADKYPARHYMLFLLGHGLIVGNDMFLYDENAPSHSLSLRDLGKVLNHFKHRDKGKELELLGFHSCSLSALEVACELEGCVNYMLASQGTEYVGSWPYREILMRMFNDVIWKKAEEDEAQRVKETIEKIFAYILNNSDDFQLAGYSFDLC